MFIKKHHWISVLFLAVFAATTSAEPVQRIHQIQRPLLNVPAIVKVGGSFTLKLKLADDQTPEAAFLEAIDSPDGRYELSLKKTGAEGDLQVYEAAVPAGTPVALYNLAVRFDENLRDTQPHSVKVIDEFKNKFDFVHITDIHFNIQVYEDRDMNLIRRRLLQDITKQNPEFVLVTGDLGERPDTYDHNYVYGYNEFLQQLRVPMFMVPGNHELYVMDVEGNEIDGLDYWVANYGPTYHSFDYGKAHFVGINNFDWPKRWRIRTSQEAMFSGTIINAVIASKQWKWLNDDITSARADGREIIAYTHIPIEVLMGGQRIGISSRQQKAPGPDTDEFVKLLAGNGCEYIFIGHMHGNEIKEFDGLTQVMTEAAGVIGGVPDVWAYRIVHVEDGKITGWDMHEIGFEDL